METMQTTTTDPTAIDTASLGAEHRDLLGALAQHRWFLRHTVAGLTDEQAARRPTASELCLGGLIKHVAATERSWLRFVVEGTAAMAFDGTEAEIDERVGQFRMGPGDSVASVLAAYDEVAVSTAAIVAGIPDLSVSHPLPEAPWFEPGASWSVRRVLVHVIAETAQHAGHADILRETIDGQKTMG
jgi:hypothetical protein